MGWRREDSTKCVPQMDESPLPNNKKYTESNLIIYEIFIYV